MLHMVLHDTAEKLESVDSVIVNESWLMFATVLHAMIMQMLLGNAGTTGVPDYRAGHIALITELLTHRS
jgi:hypothetical protein